MKHEMQPRETSNCKVCNHPLDHHYQGKGCDYQVEGQYPDSCKQCEEKVYWSNTRDEDLWSGGGYIDLDKENQ